YDKFKDLKEAVDNSYLIASKSNIEIPVGQLIFPIYSKDFDTDDKKLKDLIDDGFIKRFGRKGNSRLTDEQYEIYKQRLEYEFSVIRQMHFSGYFLIVWDFINYAKSKSIPVGPGRGSAAGSLVSYCLGITDIEPIKNNLLFERFLNPDRISMPDIDVDFCIERRDEVIKYVLKKYGFFNVAQVGTFGTLGARNVLKDVGRVMGMSFEETNRITKYIPDSNSTISEVESNNAEFKKIADNNRELFKLSKTLEGCKRHFSTHAAGIVISREPIYKLCPLYKSDALSDTGILVTQY
ncbi:MAG: DNA polymerase III subunit alpha, partial [Desulfurella sp.]